MDSTTTCSDAEKEQQLALNGDNNMAIQAAERAKINISPNIINSNSGTIIFNESAEDRRKRIRSSLEKGNAEGPGNQSASLSDNSSLETNVSSQSSSQDTSDMEELKTGRVRVLTLGCSSEANRSVRNTLLSLLAEDSAPPPQELQIGDILVDKTNKITVVQNSSLIKEGKQDFVTKFETVSNIGQHLFPGPNVVILVVEGVGSEELFKKARSQLKRVKSCFGPKVTDHVILVLGSPQVDHGLSPDKKKSFKAIKHVIYKTQDNDDAFTTELESAIVQLVNIGGYSRGTFLKVNQLLYDAVSTDLEGEIREHIDHSGIAAFLPKADKVRKKKNKKKGKFRRHGQSRRRESKPGKKTKTCTTTTKWSGNRTNNHNGSLHDRPASSVDLEVLTNDTQEIGSAKLDLPIIDVEKRSTLPGTQNDHGTDMKGPSTSQDIKDESKYNSGSLSFAELSGDDEEIDIVKSSPVSVVTRQTSKNASKSPNGRLSLAAFTTRVEDVNTVLPSSHCRFDFNKKRLIFTNEPLDIQPVIIGDETTNRTAHEEEVIDLTEDEPNFVEFEFNPYGQGSSWNSSKTPQEVNMLDQPDGAISKKEPTKRIYNISWKENGSPKKLPKKQDFDDRQH